MDQSQFAAAIGVLPQHVTNWKRRGMPADQHQRAADVLEWSVDELLGRASLALDPIEVQLIELYRGMSLDHRADLLTMANRWYSAAHPHDGRADPFNAKRKAPA